MNYLDHLLFDLYPYVAITVFLLGSLLRFEFSQYSWRSSSSQLLRGGRAFRYGSNLFHVGIILLLLGHAVGLLMPHALYPYLGLTPHSKQLLAMISGGSLGSVCLVGLLLLLQRRLCDARVRRQSQWRDIAILVLLLLQLLLGLATIPVSAEHLDGSEMLKLADWTQRIVTLRGHASDSLQGVAVIFKWHLFLGLTLLLVFPFTRLVHIWSVPLGYLRRPYQIVRRRA